MKQRILYFSAAFLSVSVLFSCGSQDDIYQQYVKKGGYDYPAKSINLSSVRGYQSVILKWEKPMDPAVTKATLFWDNYSNSLDIDYSAYPDGKIAVLVKDLEDRSYTFDIVNYDGNGNKSLPAELTASPYGDGWMVSRSERSVSSAKIDGNDAKIVMTKSTDEMIATRFRYKNLSDEWVDFETVLKPGETEITFPNALKGKRFQYSSAFCPKAGKDTVWRTWMTSANGIAYQLNGKRWTVTATTGQVFSENTPDKIFDGNILSGCRWHSSKAEATKNNFPKILVIDTQASVGGEFAFTDFTFCESPESPALRYIKDFVLYVGSSAYNPNDGDYSTNFGIPFLSGTLKTSAPQQTFSASQGASGRFFSIVFKNSWDTTDGYIDLWELIPYGFVPSQAD